ncbi:MAG: hypothetical protein MJ252_17335 [archaeon]|nr:hypothetical protein [archaeon]
MNIIKEYPNKEFNLEKINIQQGQSEESINCNSYFNENFKFFFLAFILGAYWNVDRIQKIGVL